MKGIMFTESLFHKVVKGEKTQTRRIIALQPGEGESYEEIGKGEFAYISLGGMSGPYFPPYKLGATVYLKEPYCKDSNDDIHYKFGYPENQKEMDKHNLKWSNKLFMPESAARHFIKITAVRAERLRDISEEDCFKEGIEYSPEAVPIGYPFGAEFPYNNGFHNYTTAKEAYAALIDKINGKGTWESNPWVWIYSFILIR